MISLVMGHIPCVFLVNESPSAASFLYAFYQTSKKVCRSNEAGVLNTLSAVMPPHVSSWAVTVPPHHTSVGAERRGFSRVGFTGEVVFMAFENNTSAHTHTHTHGCQTSSVAVCYCVLCMRWHEGGAPQRPLNQPDDYRDSDSLVSRHRPPSHLHCCVNKTVQRRTSII